MIAAICRFSIFILIIYSFQTGLIAQSAPRYPVIDQHFVQTDKGQCYTKDHSTNETIALRCVPDFINAAFNMKVEITNECGRNRYRPTKFCVQSSHQKINRFCDICNSYDLRYAHPASYLTDFNDEKNETWWQSETMLEGIKYPHSVNLTLQLGKAFDITYVRLKFMSPRPESFRILKKTSANSDWVPWIYYSGSCRATYKLPEKAPILPTNEAFAQCIREFSDISPLTGGNIAFSTLEGRPSSENFEESEVLQDWVTATEIRICLDRMNTFGDEIFGDSRVLRSYYWAISDFAVGGRCKCNGHASECVKSTGEGKEQLVCDCQHHTTGDNCQKCDPFYVDRPWRPATSIDANECLPCNCNGLSNRCFFDQKLFDETGHGGHCTDCAKNTMGPHCEKCAPNHWRKSGEIGCSSCHCDSIGSVNQQCDSNGKCKCKPGVDGLRCDQCKNGFYAFSSSGCQNCHCLEAGSLNKEQCSIIDGKCKCKANVEGQRCDRCRPGFFQLSNNNDFGCNTCFCYGHSSMCLVADGFYAYNLTSNFFYDKEGWTAISDKRFEDIQWVSGDEALAVSQVGNLPVYFQAPSKFLGDQRFIYGQHITLTLRLRQNFTAWSRRDFIIIGCLKEVCRELAMPLNSQGNVIPSTKIQEYIFRVHANPRYQWSPTLAEADFISILSNVSSIRVRGTYSRGDVGFLYSFSVGSATKGLFPELGIPRRHADWVETCQCPKGHTGQFCENCAPGYRRIVENGGPLAKCIKCACNEHSQLCDPETGVCHCEHNTMGIACESCSSGYYGNALLGTSDACKKCDCPNNGPCILVETWDTSINTLLNDTICTSCPEGYGGKKCEYCADEYFGDPFNGKSCQRCDCNGNVDPNAIRTCDIFSGECLKCVHQTTGFHCEKCIPGFWGDARSTSISTASILPQGINKGCVACNCYEPGSIRPASFVSGKKILECRQRDGQCECQPNVAGQYCNECQPGFFNITSGYGCEPCNCNPLGAIDGGLKCNMKSGECECKPGVTGTKCDQCEARHYGFGEKMGCQQCQCDPYGAEDLNCDIRNGQCLCRNNIEGKLCNKCAENFFNLKEGCLPCDECYTLIQFRKNEISRQMNELQRIIDDFATTPVSINDTSFNSIINETQEHINALYSKLFGEHDIQLTAVRFKELQADLIKAINSVTNASRTLKSLDYMNDALELRIYAWNIEHNEVRKELFDAIKQIQTRGQQISYEAQSQLNKGGRSDQQVYIFSDFPKLSKLADEAIRIVQHQEEDVRQIRKFGTEALEMSRKAFADAHEATFGEMNNPAKKITELSICVNETERLLNGTQMLSIEINTNAENVRDDAARILSAASDVKVKHFVPIVNELYERNINLSTETKVLERSLNDLIELHKSLQTRTKLNIDAENVKFSNAKQQYEETYKKLNELNVLLERANNATHISNKIWQDMQNTLITLEEFKVEQDAGADDDEKTQKILAKEEIAKIHLIEHDLEKVNTRIDKIELAMDRAEENAKYSLEIATKTENDAFEFANLLTSIADKAQQLQTAVGSALSKLREANFSIIKAEDTSNDQIEAFTRNREKMDSVLKNAALAYQIARSANESATRSEDLLGVVARKLDFVEPVDDAELKKLEKLVDQLENEFNQAGVEGTLRTELHRDNTVQMERRRLKSELDELTNELLNLMNIRDMMPKNCFNKVRLEQEGQ